ncbi:MAG: Gfo/Idh/MocA family oxidoreductase [Oscillospiraceae bacterium]|jgi:predicted dehydrogenase|nr:Gfo/Idh/MocA family oxidoreductase [Oscillospiraceae bacterium]
MAEHQPVSLAVIGYGGMGQHHAHRIPKELPKQFRCAGVFDILEERRLAARHRGLPAYESRGALLNNPEIELVVVATPNDAHKEIVIDALEHGKNVICEKPVTMTSSDFEEMAAAARRSGKLFTVHQNRRWDSDYRTAKRVVDENLLGSVFHIESRVHGSRGIPGDWRNQKERGGGMVLDWGVHLLDQMLQIMGQRRLLSLYAQLTYVTNEECDDGFRVYCTFEGGTTYLVEILTSNFIALPRWYILGENGTARARGFRGGCDIVNVARWQELEAVPVQAGVGLTKTMAPRNRKNLRRSRLRQPKDDWAGYYRNIYDVLRAGAPPDVTLEQQRRLLRVIEAIFVSAQENRAVEVE